MGMATEVVNVDLWQQVADAIQDHHVLTDRLKSLRGDKEEEEPSSEDDEVS